MKTKALISSSIFLAVTTSLMAVEATDAVVELEETILTATESAEVEDRQIARESATASKFEIPIADTPRSIAVITKQQMEDRGVKTVQDALLYTPGIYAGAYGFDTRGDWAKVRGVMPQDYRDGLKSLFGFYNNTRPEPYTLESIEVVKGPASVLYGQGSLGGIINVTTKRPFAGTLREIELQYGTDDWRQVGFDFNDRIDEEGKFLFRAVGLYREANTMVDYVENDAIAFAPSFSWQPTEMTSFTLIGNFQDTDSGPSTQFLPLEGTLLPGRDVPPNTFIGEPGWDTYDTQQRAITGLFEHRFNDIWSVEAKARYTDSEADYRAHWVAYTPIPTINPDGTVTRTIYESDHPARAFVKDLRVKSEFATGIIDHKVAVGVDHQDSTTDNDVWFGYAAGGTINIYDPVYGNLSPLVPPANTPAVTTTQFGLYASDHLVIADRTIVSLGIRRDRAKSEPDGGSAVENYATTSDVALMYQFDNGFSPYVSYAESFEPIAGTDINGDPFKPKEGTQHEVGVKYTPAAFPALFTLALFDIEETNRPTSVGGGAGQIQTGEVDIHGAEFSAQTHWHDLYFQFGYSYLDTEVVDEGTRLASVPDHLLSSWVTYRPSTGVLKGFRIGVGGRHAGNTWDGSDTWETPSYTLFDAMAGYDFGTIDLALNVTNIEDEEYITSSEAGTGYYGYGRRVILTARARF